MSITYQEAAAAITARGERFETTSRTSDGVTVTMFVNAPATLRDVFATARDRGDATFLVYEDERWSFADVMSEVDALSAALVERYGVSKGDRVAISMRNYPEWVISWAAALSVGAIAVSMNAWWTPDEIDFALGDCTPKVLIADEERVARAADACARRGIALLGVRLGSDDDRVDQWASVVVRGATPPHVDVDPDDDATILYTSGTTGNPKGAVSTHRAVIQSLWGFFARTALDKARGAAGRKSANRPVFILIVPLFHVTGCIPVMLSCFANGLKLVMMRKWDADRALELIERETVTTFVGVPTQSYDLLRSPRFDDFDTSSLVGVGGGGAPAPTELVRQVKGSFANASPTIAYGLTETNAYGPQNSGNDYLEHPSSAGRATPILQIEARDEFDALPPGGVGELWIKGPNLIRGYWNNAQATHEAIVDGWLRTGDIGSVDDDGFVYISDRAKDVVLRGGENVYCAEVENVMYELPGVLEVAVFGIPDERLGEQVVAVVHRKPGVDVGAESLLSHVAGRLASFKVPARIVFSDAPLPRNAAGKFLKRSLRDAFH